MIRTVHHDPRYAVLLIMLITISGIAGFLTRPKLEDPRSNVRRGQITTFLPGASPTEVESQVTEPIEMALREAKGIRTVESSSQRDVSVIFVRLTDEVEDVDSSWAEIQDKLSEVAGSLPDRASKPTLVDERRWDSYTTVVAIVDTRTSPTQPAVLARWATELENRLRFVPGTRFTERFGFPDEEILVEIDELAIAATGLTLDDIADRIRKRDSLAPDATSQTPGSSLPVRLTGDIASLDLLRSTSLRSTRTGTLLRLRDIAKISRSEFFPARNLAFVDGNRAVAIGTRMDTDYVIDSWTRSHMRALEDFQLALPAGLELRVLFSQKHYTDERATTLYGSLALGMAFVAAVVCFMMGWRATIPICLALPLSLLAVFFLMIPCGVSFHQMSIAGLILALGMLIDNPIIVVDDIQRRLDAGSTSIDATVESLRHLVKPLVGSNLTTALAFSPLLLIPGTTGEYLGQLGWAVIASISSSLALSLSLIPVIASWTLTPSAELTPNTSRGGGCLAFLGWLMRHRLLTIMLSTLIPLSGFAFSGELEEQFFPQAERDHFHFSVRLPTQATVRDTQQVARRASQIILSHDEVDNVSLFVGTNAPMVHYSMVASDENRPEFAQGLVTTTGKVEPQLLRNIQQELDEKLPSASCVVTLIEQGPPTLAPIEFRIYGPSIRTLHELGESARRIMMEVPGVISTRATLEAGGPDLSLDVRQHDAASAYLSDESLAKQLRDTLDGVIAATLDEEAEEVPVRVRLLSADASSAERVLALPIVARDGQVVPIASVANWSVGRQLVNVTRRDSSRCNTIQGTVAAGELPVELENAFRERLEEQGWALPAGYRMDFGGVSQERNSAVGNLLAYAAIIAVLIVSVLVVTLRSFRQAAIIGAVAILALGAGLLSLWLFGFPMGLMAIIGLLGMMGLAINDSIVVLTDAKASIANGFQLHESVAKSTRHVLATSLTTAAGVAPLVIAGGEFWPPMMIVIGGGVVGATFLALGFTPALYSLTCKGGRMNLLQWKRKADVRSDEWIVITGSTSGIGQGFLRRICEAGCNVLTVSDEREKLWADKEAMEEEFGVKVECRCVDLSCTSAVLELGEELARLNIIGLINNAGFGLKGELLAHPASRYVDNIAVNATAPVILQHAVLPQLREKDRGLIINVASINAYVPIPNNQVYTATKSFLMSFALAVEAENDQSQIVFQLLLPGTTRTPFHDKQGADPPANSTMTVEDVVGYSLNNLDQSICIPNARDRAIARVVGGPIPKRTVIAWVRREAERRLGLRASRRAGVG
ncbi:Multidrug resistance protein MdtC [Maioricimonas rarisocia]|uniref:Multidrug resistance protein MdtC n=1 Tax=Maioricimonas rarisocia TaxID=2528026 RepID=A0A517Z0E9_9PLAN|nr:efflux RND transporter permease subunit [Maioricimonas rarisocia]QDU35956.1 Multidrug resistance protein MdtC [Maioricimonas rarisocia]